MTTDKTRKASNPDEARTPEEVAEYNDQVWDMVLRKIHVVALYVLLQIVLISLFQTHPAYEAWSMWIYGGQFLGAWTVFYGTLLRDMGFRCWSGMILIALAGASVTIASLSDCLGWSDAAVQRLFLVQLIAAAGLWALTLYRWRILKKQYLKARDEGLVP